MFQCYFLAETLWLRPGQRELTGSAARLVERGVVSWLHEDRELLLAKRTRRRNLLALGIDPGRAHLATRSRKGYWRMSQNSLVRTALNNRWLDEQGVPDMRAIWIVLHYGPKARV